MKIERKYLAHYLNAAFGKGAAAMRPTEAGRRA